MIEYPDITLKFTPTEERLPLDGSDPDESYPLFGYLVVSDLGAIHQMGYSKHMKRFHFRDITKTKVDMNCIKAWVPLEWEK